MAGENMIWLSYAASCLLCSQGESSCLKALLIPSKESLTLGWTSPFQLKLSILSAWAFIRDIWPKCVVTLHHRIAAAVIGNRHFPAPFVATDRSKDKPYQLRWAVDYEMSMQYLLTPNCFWVLLTNSWNKKIHKNSMKWKCYGEINVLDRVISRDLNTSWFWINAIEFQFNLETGMVRGDTVQFCKYAGTFPAAVVVGVHL